MTRELERIGSENFKKLYETVVGMQESYSFYYPPVFDGFEELRNRYRADLIRTARDSRQAYLTSRNTPEGSMERFIERNR